jgi:dienelactone hydrolase
MSFIYATLFTIAATSSSTIWVNASDFENGIRISDTAEYTVWIWSEGERTSLEKNVTIGKETLAYTPRTKKNEPYIWVNAGTVKFKKGSHSISAPDTAAMISLSLNPDFRPERALRDRRVLQTPTAVHDRRADGANHTDTVFSMPHFHSHEEWEAASTRIRHRILLGSGLYPFPEKTPLNANITGRIERDGYSVEKVHFEAFPGIRVTGNLYRPTTAGKHPGIIMPHGHWEKGRLENTERGSVPARAITMAKLGAVSFTYDMVGYNDSLQLEHRWTSNEEKIWGIHPFAIQLWSAVRALDFLETLDDVDPKKLACTGASGGGTQTFAITAIDQRVTVAAPVNMISSTMQGGCICENAPVLRLANSNMEIGAIAAPRPLLMVSATGDWTRETPRVEYPSIQSVYRLYGKDDHVTNVHVDAPHNYNQASREAMYRFFGKWLLGRDDMADYKEPPFVIESDDDLRVFPEKTNEADQHQEALIARLITYRKAAAESTLQKHPDWIRGAMGTVISDLTGAALPDANHLNGKRISMEERGDYVVERWTLGRGQEGDVIPALFYRGTETAPQDAVLIVHGGGKAALANPNGNGPGEKVMGYVRAGTAVLAIDPFLTGEHHSPYSHTKRTRVGSFMDTFEPTDTALRVQDILTATSWLRSRRDLSGSVDLVGLEDGGVWSLLAAGIYPDYRSVSAELNESYLAQDKAWSGEFYIPGIRSVGDIQLAKKLVGPDRLTIRTIAE